MPKYIDADKFERHLENCICEVENTNGCPDDYMIILKALQNASPAEVAPVVHGQWVPAAANSDELYNCSNCHCFSDRETYFHCPWCGAKMDGEKNG